MTFKHFTYQDPTLNGFLSLSKDFHSLLVESQVPKDLIHILWNPHDKKVQLNVDGRPLVLPPQHLTTITFLHQIDVPPHQSELTSFSFNRAFYCIHDHDEEVSCNGIIFFGTQDLPIIQLDESEQRRMDLLYRVFLDEFETRDNIQGEMLRMLLKRLIIITTRLAKQQLVTLAINDSQVEIIRQFQFLVDIHFRTKKTVKAYADELYKSPKTLSNLFKRYNQKTPLRIIHERIVLEAKRLLLYTDKSAKEIAFELGFEESATFHKLFKKMTGVTPQVFREKGITGS